MAKELGSDDAELPNFVSIAPVPCVQPGRVRAGFPRSAICPAGRRRARGDGPQGGTRRAHLSFKVEDLDLPPGVDKPRADARLGLLGSLRQDFLSSHPGIGPVSHQDAYQRAVRLMRSAAAKAFNLDEEPAAVRDAYGRTAFGQGCLLARRLVERGVPFVEVTLSAAKGPGRRLGHAPAELRRRQKAQRGARPGLVDPDGRPAAARSARLDADRLDGRVRPHAQDQPQAGRDHFPTAWTTVLAGGGIKGGQVIGRTGPDGMQAKDRPVPVPDLLATVCKGLGVDPMGQNDSDIGRPIRIVDPKAKPIQEVLA